MRSWLKTAALSLVEDAPVLVFLVVVLGASLVLPEIYPGPRFEVPQMAVMFSVQAVVSIAVGVCLAYPAIWLLRRIRSGGEGGSGWGQFVDRYLSTRQVVGIFVVMLWWTLFVTAFDTVKSYIPIVFSFRWDEALMEIDRVVHGGHHPWRLLFGFMNGSTTTVLVDKFYFSWYTYLLLVLMLHAWSPERKHRFRFLVSFAAVWVLLGNLMAAAASSAGPIYFDRVTDYQGNPYSALLAHLEAVHATDGLHAMAIRDQLWANFQTERGFGAIAAMPSVHVAVAVLGALSAQAVDRRLGVLGWLYAAGVLVGSVYLGWHYALDGYVAILATVLIYRAAGPVTDAYWRKVVDPARQRLSV